MKVLSLLLPSCNLPSYCLLTNRTLFTRGLLLSVLTTNSDPACLLINNRSLLAEEDEGMVESDLRRQRVVEGDYCYRPASVSNGEIITKIPRDPAVMA